MSLPTPYYQDEHVTLYHGDCLKLAPSLPQADLVVADPPYSISQTGSASAHVRLPGKGSTKKAFFDGDDNWPGMTAYIAARISAYLTAPSVYVWCGHRQFGRLVDDMEANGYTTRCIVWQKTCPVPAPPGVGWDSAVELCVYGFRPGRVWTPPTGAKVPNFITADSYRHGQPGKVGHPTQKPMATASLLIERSSLPGSLVVDPFAGSGTTLRAAKDLGRRSIGIEIEERYCEIAARRCAQEVLF